MQNKIQDDISIDSVLIETETPLKSPELNSQAGKSETFLQSSVQSPVKQPVTTSMDMEEQNKRPHYG